MSSSAGGQPPKWLLAALMSMVLVLAGGVGALLIANHLQSVAAAERLQAVTADQVEADQRAAQQTAAADQAAADQAAADQAAAEKAAREKAARERAAREKAAREKAAREKAAREKAAREQAFREQAAAGHVITGEMTEPDINGALVTQVGGYPGQPLNEFGMRDLNRLGAMINSLPRGRTYPCPGGSGGGYSDIVAGGQVVVEDGAGAILATTTLRGGRVNTHGCTFTFQAQVRDAPFYRVTVTHRGAMTYSRGDMVASGWHVAIRL